MENKNLCGAAYALNAQDMYTAFISPREISMEGKILLARQRVELFVDDLADRLDAEFELRRFKRKGSALNSPSFCVHGESDIHIPASEPIGYWMPKGTRVPKDWDIDEDIKNWNKAWMEGYEETRKQERKLFDIILGKPTKQQP